MNFSAEMNVCSSAVLHTRPHWDNHMLWLCFSLSSSSPTLLPWSHAVLLIYLLIHNSSALQRLLLSCSLWSAGTSERSLQKPEHRLCGPCSATAGILVANREPPAGGPQHKAEEGSLLPHLSVCCPATRG